MHDAYLGYLEEILRRVMVKKLLWFLLIMALLALVLALWVLHGPMHPSWHQGALPSIKLQRM
ncbi:hypothetical protein AUC71_01640 [Methyloceanibacter marginalis]|uniref:Uncharacterized protein n=1 Tax=Methyloceanibacter marginalis TaxID=1774971 RepID=A0A1E3WBV0_9HYPH|nr:hypothetical protein AUC71_01640 [Methyloceanibacter marginalis]